MLARGLAARRCLVRDREGREAEARDYERGQKPQKLSVQEKTPCIRGPVLSADGLVPQSSVQALGRPRGSMSTL